MKVELRHICKSFGPVMANNGLRLTFESGHIYGLLGENGAGKTTLMKILSGFLSPDSGEILINDRPVRIQSPADALKWGIGMLQQDPVDFPPFNVLENFILGRGRSWRINRHQASLRLKSLADRCHFHFNPQAGLRTLSIGERQQLEILGLLASEVKVLILDEPTTGISFSQKTSLFSSLRLLACQGRLIILVSHKLEDIQELCDRAVVLRQGELAGQEEAPLDPDRLLTLMFGRLPAPTRGLLKPSFGQAVMELSDFCVEERRIGITDLSLTVHRGEVIGLAGTAGSGRRLFLQGCAGLRKIKRGRIRIYGKDLTGRGYLKFRISQVAYVPADRLESGLVRGLTLTEHLLLTQEDSSFLINWTKAKERAASRLETFHILGTPDTRVESLSGGNQQRALLALLPDSVRLLLLEHPTRGLDLDSAQWVWERLQDGCAQGTAILFISNDLQEILDRSDAVLVFSGGRVSPLLKRGEVNGQKLAEMIGGRGL
jgi:general nucleoside transport system ATP-binding protein